jgi:hypothetical protein
MKDKLAAITSPFGEIKFYNNYGIFTPEEGSTFCPVLVHVAYKKLDSSVFDTINMTLNSDSPPIMLFTYGNKFANVADLVNMWKEDGFTDAIHAIVSIHNDRMGVFEGWGTLHNNLPEELEALLNEELNEGKYVGAGNKLAENIGCILNKPVISFNFIGDGDEEEYDLLHNVINFIPEYKEYNYQEAITNWQPIATREDTCGLCQKRRGPLKFFYRLQSFLCPVCERKIKKRGVVNFENYYAVGFDLKQQRINTRRSRSHLKNPLAE